MTRIAILLSCLLLAACGESAAEYRSNEARDYEIKSTAADQVRTEERLQKQIDELKARVDQLEKR